jgi:hypothetical protein
MWEQPPAAILEKNDRDREVFPTTVNAGLTILYWRKGDCRIADTTIGRKAWQQLQLIGSGKCKVNDHGVMVGADVGTDAAVGDGQAVGVEGVVNGESEIGQVIGP